MTVRRLSAWPFYPALVVGALVAHRATEGDLPLPWMLRPTLVAMGVIILIQLVATVVVRNRRYGAVVALVAWPWLLGDNQIAAAILGAAAGVELVGRLPMNGLAIRELPYRLTPALNVLSVAFVIATGFVIVPSQLALAPGSMGPIPEPANESAPDIWVLVLDGYPRADTLSDEYGFDNQPFQSALEALGFDVAETSRSNYNQTILTLASMLSMQHVGDIPELRMPLSPAAQYRTLSQLLSTPRAVELLHEAGYRVVSVPSPFLNVSIRASDTYLDGGQLTWFEMDRLDDIATTGPLGRLLASPLAEQHRARIRDAFETLRDEARAGRPGPTLLFAHVMAPHAPFLFGADGSDRPLPSCFPDECSFWSGWVSQLSVDRAAFNRLVSDQVEYVNVEALAVVRAILDHSGEPPVIVLMSDHGSRLDPENPDEMFRNFFAAHTPGHSGMFGEDTTPISLFPRLLGAYLGIDVDEPPPTEYFNPGGAPLDIQPYAPAN